MPELCKRCAQFSCPRGRVSDTLGATAAGFAEFSPFLLQLSHRSDTIIPNRVGIRALSAGRTGSCLSDEWSFCFAKPPRAFLDGQRSVIRMRGIRNENLAGERETSSGASAASHCNTGDGSSHVQSEIFSHLFMEVLWQGQITNTSVI